MEINFLNGTALQKSACQTVMHNLLNLPFDSMPLVVTVEFVADPSVGLHNEFAYTEVNYDSQEATIRIASIAPDWSPPWDGVRFLQEVFAHELGHAFFASLPQEKRVAVAQMFGASSDDPEELAPPGTQWQGRILEGIAETFKDAFLPQRFRKFPNRTEHTIPLNRYPAFRAIFRHVEEEGCSVPAANLDFFNDEQPFNPTWPYEEDPSDYLWTPDDGLFTYGSGFWTNTLSGLVHAANVPLDGTTSALPRVWNTSLRGRGEGWVLAPQTFDWNFDFGPAEFLDWANVEAVGGSLSFAKANWEIGFAFRIVVTLLEPVFTPEFYVTEFRIRKKGGSASPWEKQSPWGSEAPGLADPPAIYSGSFTVSEDDVGDGKCGSPYTLMRVDTSFNIGVNDTTLGSRWNPGTGFTGGIGAEALPALEYYLSKVPMMEYSSSGLVIPGQSRDIAVPPGLIESGDYRRGVVPSRRPVVGR